MKKEKMELIEKLLSKAVILLSEKDYLNLINKNNSLRLYDSLLSQIDNDDISPIYLNKINEIDLDNIIEYLKKELA